VPPIHTGINSIRANSARETIEICSLPPTNSSATWSIPFSAPTNATAPLTRLTNFERYGLRVLGRIWNRLSITSRAAHKRHLRMWAEGTPWVRL
jgi:hypothetical protein